MSVYQSIALEDGWSLIVSRGFVPLEACLDGGREYRATFKADDWMQIYTTVYQMCTQRTPKPYSAELYVRVGEAMSSYLTRVVLPAVQDLHGQFMLNELQKRWNNHQVMVRWVRKIFDYLDRFHVKRAEKLSLHSLGSSVFLEHVFAKVKKDVRDAVLEMVQAERDGATADRWLLSSMTAIYVEMGAGELDVYIEELEAPLLMASVTFYSKKAAVWSEQCSCPEFLINAERALDDELARRVSYLHAHTEELLLRVCEVEVLLNHEKTILNKENSGLVALLQQNKTEDLTRMYRLYSGITSSDGLQPIASIFQKHIEREGFAIVAEQRQKLEALENAAAQKAGGGAAAGDKSTSDYVTSLLKLHDRYFELVKNCFGDSPVFHKAMRDAFEAFLNEKVGKAGAAELLAGYCDALLNTSGIGAKMSEEEVEEQLERVVRLFEFLAEKDMFQEFSRKLLAKRLLLERSHSDDAERSLIAKLKQRCGTHYTTKLEGMITDMNLSRDMQKAFAKWSVDRASGVVAPAQTENASGNNPNPSSPENNNNNNNGSIPNQNPTDSDPMQISRGSSAAEPSPSAAVQSASAVASAAAEQETQNAEESVSATKKAPQDEPVGALGSSSVCVVGGDEAGASSTVMIGGVDCNVRVLTTSHWPTYKEDKLNLAPELERCIMTFREFYDGRTSQRILRWMHSLGKATLECSAFTGNAKVPSVELQVSTHQMCILLLYNDADTLSFGEIKERSGIVEHEQAKMFVLSLCKKYALLVRKGEGSGRHGAVWVECEVSAGEEEVGGAESERKGVGGGEGGVAYERGGG